MYRRLLARDAMEALEEVGEARLGSPETIMTGEMSVALARASTAFKAIEDEYEAILKWYPVKRLYSGVSTDFTLLHRMAEALRARMKLLNNPYISGVDYFHKRLDNAIMRGASLVRTLAQED